MGALLSSPGSCTFQNLDGCSLIYYAAGLKLLMKSSSPRVLMDMVILVIFLLQMLDYNVPGGEELMLRHISCLKKSLELQGKLIKVQIFLI